MYNRHGRMDAGIMLAGYLGQDDSITLPVPLDPGPIYNPNDPSSQFYCQSTNDSACYEPGGYFYENASAPGMPGFVDSEDPCDPSSTAYSPGACTAGGGTDGVPGSMIGPQQTGGPGTSGGGPNPWYTLPVEVFNKIVPVFTPQPTTAPIPGSLPGGSPSGGIFGGALTSPLLLGALLLIALSSSSKGGRK
jgi:hypothetical protein